MFVSLFYCIYVIIMLFHFCPFLPLFQARPCWTSSRYHLHRAVISCQIKIVNCRPDLLHWTRRDITRSTCLRWSHRNWAWGKDWCQSRICRLGHMLLLKVRYVGHGDVCLLRFHYIIFLLLSPHRHENSKSYSITHVSDSIDVCRKYVALCTDGSW